MQEFNTTKAIKLPNGKLCILRDGYIVILPNEKMDLVPLDCPICELLIRDYEDCLSYEKYSCCASCALNWAEGNFAKWTAGWRPSSEEIKKFKNKRLQFPSYKA